MISQRKINSYFLLTIVVCNCLLLTYAYPQNEVYQRRIQQLQRIANVNGNQEPIAPVYRGGNNVADAGSAAAGESISALTGRKFAVKPNASKKVALDEVEDDVESNQLQETTPLGGFSWSNMLSTVLNMFFTGANVNQVTKTDDVDSTAGFGGSPWANVISMGLKIINALLGGGAPSDGIDKVDNGGSPMQGVLAAVLSSFLGTRDPEQVNSMAKQAGEFIQIVMNLLDALKTSFSHRSLTARSMGKRDSMSDAAVAGISLLKGYVRTYRSADEKCMQRYICEANTECVREIGGSSIFCQLGSYATSFVLDRTVQSTPFDKLYDAGRRGRNGSDCHQLYLECNEV